jgi:ZIP family zinc transporter
METLYISFFAALVAGITIPIGGLLARFEHLQPQWLEEEFRHSVIAFGGGVLLAAVSLVLVPEGISHVSTGMVIIAFLGGGVAFLLADYYPAARGASAAQLMAMLLDFLPEAMALGALLAVDKATSYLLAFLIALQNLPESFNAYRELQAGSSLSSGKILGLFLLIALLGPGAAVIGLCFLASLEKVLDVIMLFSAGGILYLIFQDIAPNVRLKRHWGPPLGAVLGFLLGLIGHMFIH